MAVDILPMLEVEGKDRLAATITNGFPEELINMAFCVERTFGHLCPKPQTEQQRVTQQAAHIVGTS